MTLDMSYILTNLNSKKYEIDFNAIHYFITSSHQKMFFLHIKIK